MNILHLLPRLTGGGPARALIALVKAQARLGFPYRHRLMVLKKDAYPPTLMEAKRAGIAIVRAPGAAVLAQELESADVVCIHFWNTPELYALMQQALPPARLVLWSKILGDTPPQALPAALLAFVDWCIATNEATLALPALKATVMAKRTGVIHPVPDYERMDGARPRPHETFNVGYIGTVNANKLHPNFVAMCAAVTVPNIRFVVCGGGEQQIATQAAALGVSDRFQLLGYVENIAGVLETLDVFGYPLAPDNYSSTDVALQEVMYFGIPPVIFPYGGTANLVRHNETGLVVHDEAEYKGAIEYLYHHPAERKRLGDNARAFVLAHLTGDYVARAFDAVYSNALRLAKHARAPLFAGYTPAQLFAATLGDAAPGFAASVRGASVNADEEIANSSIALAMGEGGLFHYRNTYPDDPLLHYWTGLVLEKQGRRELAAQEFRTALSLGMDAARPVGALARLAGHPS